MQSWLKLNKENKLEIGILNSSNAYKYNSYNTYKYVNWQPQLSHTSSWLN